MSPTAIAAIAGLLARIASLVIEAFAEKDPAKLRKVTDALDERDPVRLAALMALEEEKLREHYGLGGDDE